MDITKFKAKALEYELLLSNTEKRIQKYKELLNCWNDKFDEKANQFLDQMFTEINQLANKYDFNIHGPKYQGIIETNNSDSICLEATNEHSYISRISFKKVKSNTKFIISDKFQLNNISFPSLNVSVFSYFGKGFDYSAEIGLFDCSSIMPLKHININNGSNNISLDPLYPKIASERESYESSSRIHIFQDDVLPRHLRDSKKLEMLNKMLDDNMRIIKCNLIEITRSNIMGKVQIHNETNYFKSIEEFIELLPEP